MSVFDVWEKRKEWKETLKPDMLEHLVFLGESGANTDRLVFMAKLLLPEEQLITPPLNTPQTTTVLSSIRFDGENAFITYQGGTTGERFVQYLKETLIPTLRPGDIVVMDNLRSYHVKAVQKTLETAGMKALYLPAYSPDINPIEKMWSKVKALLRAWKIRSLELLPDAISPKCSPMSLCRIVNTGLLPPSRLFDYC